VRFVYATAPASVNRLKAIVAPYGRSGFNLAFSSGTFSQSSDDPANVNGVGNYTYAQLSPSSAQLSLNFTAPPQAKTAAPQTVNLTFDVPNVARYGNDSTAGDMVFTSAPAIAAHSLVGQTLVHVSARGQGRSVNFAQNQKAVSTDIASRTATGGTSYGFTNFSPVASLLRVSSAGGSTWSVLNYLDADHGLTYNEHYDAAGNFIGTDTGVFGRASQRIGGNAPKNLANGHAVVTSVDNRFKLMFADALNFQQVDPDNDGDIHATGTYAYQPTTTNAGVLELNYTAPTETSSAVLQFFAPDMAVFTNADHTVGAAVFK
jgi:hypothetical protein